MKAYNTSTYLMGKAIDAAAMSTNIAANDRHGFMPQDIPKRISKKISSLLLLLICALTLAACGGGGGGGGNPGNPGNTDVGLIRYCDFDTTARYNANNVLPIKEYSTAECEFQLPRNELITAASPSNLTLRISVNRGGERFPCWQY